MKECFKVYESLTAKIVKNLVPHLYSGADLQPNKQKF